MEFLIPSFELIVRVTVIYFVILVCIRLTGKREIGQMSPFDLVLLLLIASAVQGAMIGPDKSFLGGILAALTLFSLNAVIARITFKNLRFRRMIEGVPTLLVHNGEILKKNLKKENLSYQDLEEAFREHGIASVADVKVAVLEVDGSISVIRVSDVSPTSIPPHHFRMLRRK